MTKLQYLLATLPIFSLNNAVADTRELADGFLLDGDFIGSGNGIVMFNSGTGASPLISGQSISVPAGSIVQSRQRVPVVVPR